MTSWDVFDKITIYIGAWVAIWGVNSWRREYTGKRNIEIAENDLALFYEAIDAIKHMRSPIGSSQETQDIERSTTESESAWEARKSASVVIVRYNQHQELFNKIHAMRYRFMAQIGKDESKPFDELNDIIKDIIVAARMLSRLWSKEKFRTDAQMRKHYEDVEKNEALFWDGFDKDDPINPRIEKMILALEDTCRKVIANKNKWWELYK